MRDPCHPVPQTRVTEAGSRRARRPQKREDSGVIRSRSEAACRQWGGTDSRLLAMGKRVRMSRTNAAPATRGGDPSCEVTRAVGHD